MSGTDNDKTINERKLDHIRIVLEEEVEPYRSSFDYFRLPFKALPEIDMAEIDTGTEFLGKKLKFPFVISSMTGGPEKGLGINTHLAEAAQEAGVALGLGSMRVILRKPESIKSFDVKKYCPDVPLLANMGLVQLNYGYGADEINRIIDSVNADGIFLHVNPLQEAIQPEGDTNFKDLLPKLEKVLPKIEKPVVIKEVGTGIDKDTAKALADAGITWIDVSGTGGTSWAGVEAYRREDTIGHLFRGEGIPTAEALIGAAGISGLNLIAGGGIRNGIHIAKAIALGAKLATAAKPLLAPSLESTDACVSVLKQLHEELTIAMFSTGARTLEELSQTELVSAAYYA
ncbi:MAG: Isopentenyl-diphosphate delta-isomerase [candidate division WS6 bacterium OLB20]|uniref:Isopentenyl-diphosphate delta-isomerase n=1 Tax=candidate division WS6 bacterium OLB20 TaxID=1617426 RepID=A0A136LVZ3_9BACT|nr:MAG: Isopentenyl-diphosphate delta-isomerase [candidate division WS6 bacterium OLB20]